MPDSIRIELAALDDVPVIKKLAGQYHDELGYVMPPAPRESVAHGWLLIARSRDGEIVGFVNMRVRRDGITVIYEIGVDRRHLRLGIGTRLINAVPCPTMLKCTVDNGRANAFYLAQGFKLAWVENGRKRRLNVWQRAGDTMPPGMFHDDEHPAEAPPCLHVIAIEQGQYTHVDALSLSEADYIRGVSWRD